MDKKKQFAKTTIIIFLGKVCTKLISFFLLPLYTSYLSTSQYGIADLIQTYVTLFVPLITLDFETSIFRWLVDNRGKEKDEKKLISNSFFVIFISLLLFSIGYIIINLFINIPYRWIILLDIIICVFSENLLQVARGMGNNLDYSISCILTAVTTVVSNIILICFLGFQANGMIISMALANGVCSLYLFIRLKIYKNINFKLTDFKLLKEMFKYSLPLVPNEISWWIINISDRSIISFVLGSSFNGLYAISNKFPTIISSFTGIFNLSWSESAALHINSKDWDEFFSDVTNTILRIFVALGAGMISCLPFLFPLMINSKYNDAYMHIPPLILACIFNVVICLYSQIYFAKKMSKEIATATIIGAVVNILINIIFIKFIGLYAASMSTCIAYFVMCVYRHIDLKKYVKIKFEKGLLLQSFLIFSIAIVFYYINNLYLNILSLLIVCVYAFITNKKFLYSSFNLFKSKIKKKS